MPATARMTHCAIRQFIMAAAGALVLSVGSSALVSARAQSAYSYSGPSVTVDYSVLNRLGPAPQVSDSRVVLHAPVQPATRRVAVGDSTARHPRVVAQQNVHRPAPFVAQAHPIQHVAEVVQDGNVTIDYGALAALNPASGPRIVLRRPGTAQNVRRPTRFVAQAHPIQHVAEVVQDGNVTIDYRALAALNPASGPRIVLHRPGTATVAAATPAAPLTPPVRSAPQQALVLTPPTNRLAPSPTPAAPPPPRVATAPSARETRTDTNEFASLLPIGGVALAATRSPTEPVASQAVPQSDSRAIRFAPGATELQGDASSVLDGLAQKLKAAPADRIALIAYASGDADQAIEARRISLARAVAVRAYLIQHGVASSQINVRALGNRVTDGGSADRVDLVMTGR